MGGSISKTAQGITRQQLLASTNNSQLFINQLFMKLMEKITKEDYLKLSNPATCKQFVFTMGDAIHRLFDELRIRPTKDRASGVIYFQKIEALRTSTGDTRNLCLLIAYHYIRVFQIFGALAMTVMDDPGAGQILEILRYPGALEPSGPVRGPGKEAQPNRGFFLGGAQKSESEFKRSYPTFAPLFQDLDYVGEEGRFDKYKFFDSDELFVFPGITSDSSRNLVYKSSDGISMRCHIKIGKLHKDTEHLTITISQFTLDSVLEAHKDRERDMKRILPLLHKTPLAIVIRKEGESWRSDSGNKTLSEKLKSKFEAMYMDAYNGKIPERKRNPEEAMKADGMLKDIAGKSAASTDSFAPKMLRSGYLVAAIKKLAGFKTNAYCVSRALQLVDANSQMSFGKGGIVSSICQPKFSSLSTSLPTGKETLDHVLPFRATEQLFFTKPILKEGDRGHDLTLRPEDQQAYTSFLQDFGSMFAQPGATMTALDKMIAKDPQCGPQALKHYLQITDTKKAQVILRYVSALYGQQLEHTKRVIQFLRTRLFLIQKRKNPVTGAVGDYVDIHPKILFGGLDELANVSAEARTLLISYFKGCEETYQKGVQAVLASNPTVV